ncbi:EDSAP-1 family PEP-CTERM protein [Thalassotalea atypica]|uniref:EDSAP-1 family PEP-CTERM protein n=1 Tax=Thalassotalea atypica TaxID=2054316 RepID=UPI0025723ADD|nr:EDSAP-1 family PEP-CTERM protein [Thalassotalea atypica]
MKNFKKSLVALSAILMMGAGTAQAESVAYANLDILNLEMLDHNTGNILVLGTHVNILGGVNNTQNNSASLNASSDNTNDGTMACVGDCGVAQDTFSQQAAGTTFSRSDSAINGAIIDVGGGAGGVTAQSVSETQLNQNGMGNSDSTLQTNTAFVFTPTNNLQVAFSFSALGELFAFQGPDNNPGSSAQAGSSFTISIANLDNGAKVFEWTPDGVIGNEALANDSTDDDDLTTNISRPIPGTSQDILGGNFYASSLGFLQAGVNYVLSINHNTEVNAARDVPEPGMLFLLGLGLAGFAVRKRKAS